MLKFIVICIGIFTGVFTLVRGEYSLASLNFLFAFLNCIDLHSRIYGSSRKYYIAMSLLPDDCDVLLVSPSEQLLYFLQEVFPAKNIRRVDSVSDISSAVQKESYALVISKIYNRKIHVDEWKHAVLY